MSKTFPSALLFLVLVGCATTGPNVATNADPNTDFASIRTFGFMQPLGTDRPGGVRTPLSQMLANAVIDELGRRGMTQASQPDVLVNFFVNMEQRLDVRQIPTANTFHGYRRGRYSVWRGYETRVREYTQGTLAIDLVDPGRSLLVWEGVARGRVGRGSVEITQEQVNEVVASVLAELPK